MVLAPDMVLVLGLVNVRSGVANPAVPDVLRSVIRSTHYPFLIPHVASQSQSHLHCTSCPTSD